MYKYVYNLSSGMTISFSVSVPISVVDKMTLRQLVNKPTIPFKKIGTHEGLIECNSNAYFIHHDQVRSPT